MLEKMFDQRLVMEVVAVMVHGVLAAVKELDGYPLVVDLESYMFGIWSLESNTTEGIRFTED